MDPRSSDALLAKKVSGIQTTDAISPSVGAGDGLDHELTLDIDRCLEQLEQQLLDCPAPSEFCQALLDGSLRLLGASWGTVLVLDAARTWQVVAQVGSLRDKPTSGAGSSSNLSELLVALPEEKIEAALQSPQAIHFVDGQGNPIVACRTGNDRSAIGLLCLGWKTTPRDHPQLAITLLEPLSDILARYWLVWRCRTLQDRCDSAKQLQSVTLATQQELDLVRLSFQLANEGQRFVPCDRLVVATRRRGRLQIQAVSGVNTLQQRSDVRLRLEQLLEVTANLGEPMVLGEGDTREWPPEITSAWARYQDVSLDKQWILAPLRANSSSDSRPLGILAASFLTARSTPTAQDRLQQFAEQAQIALERAVRLAPIYPLYVLQQRFASQARATRSRHWVIATLCMFCLALPWWIPCNFQILARGQLQPSHRVHIFAPYDGVIEQVHVRHGQVIESNSELVTLRSHALELEVQRLRGEMQTIQEQLSVLTAGRLSSQYRQQTELGSATQLSADERELNAKLESLTQQQAVLETQQAELHVKSPMHGSILTWNIEQLLQSRPVTRGQRLLTIGDLDGPWQLDLAIPDRRIGHIQRFLATQSQPFAKVDFIVSAEPSVSHSGQLTAVARSATTDSHGTTTVSATVKMNPSQHQQRYQPGGEVLARIDCGKRSLAYTWLYALHEELLRRFF